MPVLPIIYFPDDPLTLKAAPVTRFDDELEALVRDLFETMDAYQGVGLAAPQVGRSTRVFVLQEPEGEPMCLINPELSNPEGQEFGEEGCLSMPAVYAMVPRATRVQVRAQNPQGERVEFIAENFLARIIQHELDHLEGILFPDRLDVMTRQSVLQEWREVRERLLSSRAEAETEHAS